MQRLAFLLLGIAAIGAAQASPRLVRHTAFQSSHVPARDVTVWLPEGYREDGPPLPVVYMQDGQNLHEDARAFGGVSWGAGETAARLIREGRIPRVIIVGIDNSAARGREYLPQRIYDLLPEASRAMLDAGWGAPQSDAYLRFLVRELKPFIDAHYRTRTDRAATFVMGSSMGGLISLYAQTEYPEVFGGSASLSMHWLLGNSSAPLPPPSRYTGQVLRAFETYLTLSHLTPGRHRIYLDRGTETLDARYVPYTAPFEAFMRRAGWRQGEHFDSRIYPGTDHSEKAWRARLADPLAFLLAPLLSPEGGAETRAEAARRAQVAAAPSPEDYLLAKFRSADIVLLAEDHAVKQNIAFVINAIPRLYAAGVTNLVMEFGAEEDQARLDRLVTAPAYDARTARAVMFNYNVMWSWQDYHDIYRAVWAFNRSLPKGKPPFRIVNMSYVFDWSGFSGLRTPATMQQVFPRGTADQFRAALVAREVLDRGEKALVLTGTVHAFTRHAAGQIQSDGDGFCQRTVNSLGNRLHASHGARITNVLLHQSLPALPGRSRPFEQPGDGAVERVMLLNGNRPVGFDLRQAPMGALRDYSYYGVCDRDLTLADLFDGYIFLAPFKALRAATPDPAFVDETNIDRAIEQFPDPDWSPRPANLAEARAHLLNMARQIDARYAALAD
ncbi:alpha/beta hydrolase [Sphingomonas sp. MS122]|uniref:alpha/beta hydrolase n=1 Tax=Sphingomonas sp. MS122 TaxID=3412683 RepID=UPI003C2F05C7